MKNLRAIRIKTGMSQAELSVASKVKLGTLVTYERCTRIAAVDKAWRIAEALDVTIEELIK